MRNEEVVPGAQETFIETWRNFQSALRSPEEFNECEWIWRLGVAAKRSLFSHLSNFISTRPTLSCIFQNAQSTIGDLLPLVVIALVVFVEVMLMKKLYQPYIVERWCSSGVQPNPEVLEGDAESSSSSQSCFQAEFIKYTAYYFGLMILWNYCLTCMTSPGLVLPQCTAGGSGDKSLSNDDSRANSNINSSIDVDRQETRFSLNFSNNSYNNKIQRRRKCLCVSVVVNEEVERKKVALFFGSGASPTDEATDSNIYYDPSPFSSICNNCGPRPPRSHHCRICNFCVLQVRLSSADRLYSFEVLLPSF